MFDDFVTENLQIFPSPKFQWYYVPDQNIWEALMFKSADSDEAVVPGMLDSFSGLNFDRFLTAVTRLPAFRFLQSACETRKLERES